MAVVAGRLGVSGAAQAGSEVTDHPIDALLAEGAAGPLGAHSRRMSTSGRLWR